MRRAFEGAVLGPRVRVVTVAAALALAGCWIGDGRLVARGKVLELGEPLRPIPGATVTIGEEGIAERTGRAQADGSYSASYNYGGMFPFDTNSRNPIVSVTAPGYQPLRWRFGDTSPSPQVKRRECEPSRWDCAILDFLLMPEDAAVPK